MGLNQAIGDAAGRLYLATAGFYHAVLSQITEDELSRDKHLEHTIHAANASSIAEYRALTRGQRESELEREITRASASEQPPLRNRLVTNGIVMHIITEEGGQDV